MTDFSSPQTNIISSQERIDAITADLDAVGRENSDLHGQLESQNLKFRQEQQSNLDTIANLRQIQSEVDSIRKEARSDLESQIKRADDAHEKYQSELVTHADDVKVLSRIREELKIAQAALNDTRAHAETAQANLGLSEASWLHQRQSLQKEIDEQKKR